MPSAHGERRRWMLYALGGGMGHLTRALALARAVVRRSSSGENRQSEDNPATHISLLTNSPFANVLPLADELGSNHRLLTISPSLSRDETADRVIDLLQTTSFDVLVVDTFPRGLGGELSDLLPRLDCPKILVHRDLNPRYVAYAGLSDFVNQFDRLLVPGESAPFETYSHAVRTAPWLIRDDHELLSSIESRRMLQVESDTLPIVAVIGCGKAEEIQQMRCLATQLTSEFSSVAAVRFVTPRTIDFEDFSCQLLGLTTVSPWPFLASIRGVSVIVGSGGYNTVHEARATGTRLIGLSQKRLYDRQHRRLEPHENANSLEEVREQVAAALASVSESPGCERPTYQNGVHQAIDVIESLYR